MSLGLKTTEYLLLIAGLTGVEPAPCAVTGRHLNRLTSIPKILTHLKLLHPSLALVNKVLVELVLNLTTFGKVITHTSIY